MTWFRGQESITTQILDSAISETDSKPMARALERLRAVVGLSPQGWLDRDRVIDRLQLTASEESVFMHLLGAPILVNSQQAIRVAARVMGEDEERNRSTDRLVDLCRLVGSGDDAALRMGAVRAIASSTCHATAPDCAACPLRNACASAPVVRGHEGSAVA